jgi:hypothetical protein
MWRGIVQKNWECRALHARTLAKICGYGLLISISSNVYYRKLQISRWERVERNIRKATLKILLAPLLL